MRLRTANNHAKHALRRRILVDSFGFHLQQVTRLGSSHKKIRQSGYVKRLRKRDREFRREWERISYAKRIQPIIDALCKPDNEETRY